MRFPLESSGPARSVSCGSIGPIFGDRFAPAMDRGRCVSLLARVEAPAAVRHRFRRRRRARRESAGGAGYHVRRRAVRRAYGVTPARGLSPSQQPKRSSRAARPFRAACARQLSICWPWPPLSRSTRNQIPPALRAVPPQFGGAEGGMLNTRAVRKRTAAVTSRPGFRIAPHLAGPNDALSAVQRPRGPEGKSSKETMGFPRSLPHAAAGEHSVVRYFHRRAVSCSFPRCPLGRGHVCPPEACGDPRLRPFPHHWPAPGAGTYCSRGSRARVEARAAACSAQHESSPRLFPDAYLWRRS